MNTVPMKVRFLGGTREVGRSALHVTTERAKILLDYGVMLARPPGFPMHVKPKDVDAIAMSHCHLDHSGAIPVFHLHKKIPVFGTRLSFDLVQVLISDFIHLSGYYLPFEYIELQTMLRSCVSLDYKEPRAVGDAQIQLLHAGHLPGSAQVLVEAEGKRLLYTSDYNLTETRLLHGADKDYGELDALIIESTYADEEHADRKASEKEFVENVTEVVENGGTVLVPAFGVGRSQEIICILAAHHFDHPVTIDGMTRKTNRIMMNHTSFLQDPRLFMSAVHSAIWVEDRRDRRGAPKKPGVIVSPAGMLKGGPAAFYVQKIGMKSRNAIFLVSYQIPGTPGRELLEKGRCVIDGKMRKVKARVEKFDFSSHSGANELKETVKSLKGSPKVYVVHGAEGNCKKFAKWVKKEMGFEAEAPRSGDTFTI